MKNIPIDILKKTAAGPAADFCGAVCAYLGSFREGELYQFGSCFVSFFTFENQIGARFYRPVKSKQGKLYSCERISSKGKRVNEGFVTLNFISDES